MATLINADVLSYINCKNSKKRTVVKRQCLSTYYSLCTCRMVPSINLSKARLQWRIDGLGMSVQPMSNCTSII